MTIKINKTNGSFLVDLYDETINASACSLALIGRGAPNYAEAFNENMVKMLENFAKSMPPVNPLAGQLWYDSVTQTMNMYNGTAWTPVVPFTDIIVKVPIGPSGPNQQHLTALLVDSNIVAAIAHFNLDNSDLPVQIRVGDTNYPVRSRFPNGVRAGWNLATDSVGYKYYGQTEDSGAGSNSGVVPEAIFASQANNANTAVFATNAAYSDSAFFSQRAYQAEQANSAVFATQAGTAAQATYATTAGFAGSSDQARKLGNTVTFNLSNDATGGTSFDGTSNVTIPVSLSATGVVPGTYNSVTVDAKGRVTAATNVTGTAAATADTLSTPRLIQLQQDVLGSALFDGSANALITASLSTTGVTAGTYGKVTVDAKGRVTAGGTADTSNISLNAITFATQVVGTDVTVPGNTGWVDVVTATLPCTAGATRIIGYQFATNNQKSAYSQFRLVIAGTPVQTVGNNFSNTTNGDFQFVQYVDTASRSGNVVFTVQCQNVYTSAPSGNTVNVTVAAPTIIFQEFKR